jgi:restriction system protein
MSDDDDTEHVTPNKQYIRRRLQQMDPERFEYFVADVWAGLGWETRVVGEPGDRGIDVIATAPEEQKQLIQAKRYGPNTTVGSPEVQQYAALRLQEESVDGVTIVTTGTFSEQAEEMAPDLDVLLVDGSDLLGMIDKLDGWEVVAAYFDDIALATNAEQDDPDGLLERAQSLLGF